MTERAWTPGPWWVDEDQDWCDSEDGFAVIGPCNPAAHPTEHEWPVAFVGNDNFWSAPGQRERSVANARLIAAAPDLYEALYRIAAYDDERAEEHLEETGSYSAFDEPGSVYIARAALAKAEGRS